MDALRVTNLTKVYNKNSAVNSISFTVPENEIFSLIGPNGAGKSTTLKMIATILSITSGEAEVFGLSVSKEPNKIREIISYLPEEAGAYKNLTGRNYIEFMSAIQTDDPEKQKKYIEFAEHMTGLGDKLKNKIKTYSKGMTRKLLLARTVMSKPKLAILDEPTSGLDVINALEIRKTIRDLAKNGMTVLLSSHNMLEIEFLSDRLAIIDKGEIKDIGTSAELKQKYFANNLEEVFIKITQ
ncbi:MAG: ABC transporter ATP-binding protein [Candidatus Doudnabacteria bacterium]|nr:ABC transporter ATP-binding protein [Candidatus Doudnabacteria bacterium]